MLATETVLQGRYRIVRQLGQGGMGAVYEAIDERLDTVVALKETFFADERLRKQFEREARLLARLHHQALPRVSDHFNEGDGQFLVMQFIGGEDLAEMLAQRNGPFPQDEVLRWADQLCDALDYLHTQDPQIIHRDIKPQNLKLTARGQIVLLDFGLAKGSAGPLTAVTTSASIFGYTPNYAPLEQIQGKGTDPRSDIYALGATLFHLLTNLKPPDALSRAGSVVNGLPDPLPLANEVRPDVSAGVAYVLSKAMAQKRDDRFATANAMRDALRIADEAAPADAATLVMPAAIGGTSGGTIASESATQLAGGQTRRMTAPSFPSEAQTLVAGEATNVRTVSGVNSATAVQPAAKRNLMPWIAAAVFLIVVVGGAAGFFAYRQRQLRNAAAQPPAIETPLQVAEPSATASPMTVAEAPTVDDKTKQAKPAGLEKSRSQSASTLKTETRPEPDTPPVPRPEDPVHDPNRPPDPNRFPRPEDFERFRRFPRREPGAGPTPQIRTLRNGTRVIKQPDGTVVTILPDGSTRVITPPKRPNRNVNRP